MPTEVTMPKLGESVIEGTLSKWLKQEGDPVAEYEPLLEVSTDKVDTEVPAPAAGILLKILVPEGETVSVGTVLCLIGQPGEVVEPAPAPAAADAATPPNGGNGQQTPPPAGVKKPHITPVVAKIAAEHGIDVTTLRGTGAG
ncbi:MAG: biotin/lipoyl-containing protein, partial [Anaerolineae bacterium]